MIKGVGAGSDTVKMTLNAGAEKLEQTADITVAGAFTPVSLDINIF